MPSSRKPEISAGQSLDVQPGVANIGENQATLEALRNANIDGQDAYPQSVSAKRMSSDDIDVSGLVRSGTMLVGSGGVTVTSDADGGTPDTGLHIASGSLQLIKSGTPQVTLDGATGDATFTGAVTATSGTFTGTIQATEGYFIGTVVVGTDATLGGAATGVWLTNDQFQMKYEGTVMVDLRASTGQFDFTGDVTVSSLTVLEGNNYAVNFGADITVGGNVILFDEATTGYLMLDGADGDMKMGYDGVMDAVFITNKSATGEILFQVTSDTAYAGNYIRVQNTDISLSTYAGGDADSDMSLAIGTNAGNSFSLKRGTVLVMSFTGTTGEKVSFTVPVKINNGPTITSGTAAPGTGTWAQGDWCLNTNVAAGGSPGWVCTTAGTPGTWKAMANVAA